MAMIEFGRADDGPSALRRAKRIPPPDAPGDVSVTYLRASASDRLLPDWRGLADRALDASPFMLPEFILPAAAHLSPGAELTLATAWKAHPRTRELIGLFVQAPQPQRALPWRSRRRSALWSHRLLPLAPVLLSSDPDAARLAVKAYIDAAMRDRIATATIPAVERGGMLEDIIAVIGEDLGLMLSSTDDAARSRGLDIMVSDDRTTTAVQIAHDPATIRAMLEQALAMDVAVDRGSRDRPPVLFDAGELSFMRAVARGFASLERIVMARLIDGERRAMGIGLAARDRVYLWRLLGPSARDPAVEAALTRAIAAAAGTPAIAATDHPIAGFCAAPLRTASLQLSSR
jgi:hypothetical protein